MGKHTFAMALSLFNTAMFPSLERRMATHHPRLLENVFGSGNRLFSDIDSTWRYMASDLDSRRQTFLAEMDIEASAEQGLRQRQGHGPYSHSYSYSSSTIQHGDGAPMTRIAESFKNSSGQHFSKRVQSMGEKVVEETIKNGETTHTLTNVSEAELEDFNKGFATQPLIHNEMLEKRAELPAALETDLAKMQQAQQ